MARMNASLARLLLLIPLFALFACGFTAWRDQVMRDLMEGRIHASKTGSRGMRSQTFEFFYIAGGRNVGYGVYRSGILDIYNADGSRAGYGSTRR
jgi:hypothetical protein